MRKELSILTFLESSHASYPYITFKLKDGLLQWTDKGEVKKERNISHQCLEINNKVTDSKTGAGQKIITFYFVPLLP